MQQVLVAVAIEQCGPRTLACRYGGDWIPAGPPSPSTLSQPPPVTHTPRVHDLWWLLLPPDLPHCPTLTTTFLCSSVSVSGHPWFNIPPGVHLHRYLISHIPFSGLGPLHDNRAGPVRTCVAETVAHFRYSVHEVPPWESVARVLMRK